MYNKNNIFAKIIRGEVPCNKVFEDETVLAFHDINKAAPVHILVIPKGEFINLPHFVSNASALEVASFFTKVAEVACSLGLQESGYRIISNIGSDAEQSVPHFHVHILGKKKLGALVVGDQNH